MIPQKEKAQIPAIVLQSGTDMSHLWKLTAKRMTGGLIHVQIENPLAATVLDLKEAIYSQDPQLPPYLQRLVFQKGSERSKLVDSSSLPSAGLCDGTSVCLIALQPYILYVQGADQKMHQVTVPSSEPELYTMTALRSLVENTTGQNLNEYQFLLRGRVIEEVRHGRQLMLRECGIKVNDTLVLMSIGLSLDVTNPQVDVCFLVDCTGSMGSHIEAVKNNVKSWRDIWAKEYRGCDLKFAFVRYTDYDQPESTRTTWIDFTDNQPEFHGFVSAIRASGGGDGPEDIMGGLKTALWKLTWRSVASKVLIHIADCPCHGNVFHNLSDNYPNGDPAGISHESLMQQVQCLEIQYWFGYIQKSTTDQMISIFNQCLQTISQQRYMIRQFDAVKTSEVGDAVNRSVADSVYGTAAAKMAMVRKFTIDPTIPNWSSASIIEQYAKKTSPPGPKCLTDLQDSLELEGPTVNIIFKMAPHPFTEGSESLVYHAYDCTNQRRVVLKQFKMQAPEFNTLECYMKELQVHTLVSTYANEFNSDKLRPSGFCNIELVPVDVVQCPSGVHYLLETFIAGKIEKFNNNSGVVCSTGTCSELLQAFSHYSWVKSGKTMLICDMQGCNEGHRVVLTDPAINSRGKSGRYGNMDTGYIGIQKFFKTHVCSNVCKRMGLEPHKL